MAVDRGGLDYPITVRDGFSSSLTKFVNSTNKARQSWDAFRKSLGTGSGGSVRTIERVNKATSSAERTTRRLTRAQQQRRAAVQRLRQEEEKQGVTAREAELASRRSLRTQRRLESVETSRLRAARRVTDQLNKQREQEQLLAEIQARRAAIVNSKVAPADKKALRELDRLEEKTRQLTKSQRVLTAEEKEQIKVLNRLVQARRRATDTRNQAAIGQARAAERIARDAERQAEIRTLRAAGRLDLLPPGSRKELPRFLEGIRKSLGGIGERVNRVSFTFRRLFGILALFTIARRGVQAFTDTLRSLIDASSNIETVELGIASLISSVSDVRDATGNVVSAAEALPIAFQEAQRQAALLRRDALLTSASFEELVEAFQVGLGPGLRAGLDIDQVRAFTRQISLAAQAIGLEQRQLSEEIRSILGGTISTRTTRIAAVLGITNEEIRNAREAGELFEFLQDRFGAFEAAGQRAANTFAGLTARVRDAFRLLLVEGGVGLFDQLKDSLGEVLSLLQSIDEETGEIILNPQAVAVVKAITDGLADAVREVSAFREGLSFDEVLSVARGLGRTFSATARAASAFVDGLIDGLNVVRAFFVIAARILGVFTDISRPVQGLLRAVAQLLTVSVALRLVISAFRPLIVTILALTSLVRTNVELTGFTLKSVRATLVAIRSVVLSTLGPLGLVVGALFLLLEVTGLLSRAFAFISNSFSSLSADAEIDRIGDAVKAAAEESEEAFGGFITQAIKGVEEVEDRLSDLGRSIADARAQNAALLRLAFSSPLGADFNLDAEIASVVSQFSAVNRDIRETTEAIKQEFLVLRSQGTSLQDELAEARQELDRFSGTGAELGIFDLEKLVEGEKVLDRIEAEIEGIQRELRQPDLSTTAIENQLLNRQAELLRQQDVILLSLSTVDRNRIELFQQQQAALAEVARLEGLATANAEQQYEVTLAIQDLEGRVADLGILQLRTDLQALNARRQEEALVNAVVAKRRQALTDAILANDNVRQELLLTQQNIDLLNLETQISEQNIRNDVRRLEVLREDVQARIRGIELQQSLSGLTEENTEALRQARLAEADVNEQIRLQILLLEDVIALRDDELQRLEDRRAILQFADDQPVAAGIVQGFSDAFDEATNLFENFKSIFASGVQGLAGTIANLMTDAFNPNSDQNFFADFTQFLANFAQSIIQTLLEIAISALALNLLSGGLLGPIVAGFAQTSLSRHDGGEVPKGYNRGGRIKGARTRVHAAHSRARGYNRGGVPNEPARIRPKGLHPADKVPIWAQAGEWVIRVASVAKAGSDAIQRVNEGMFDPAALRAAVGLGGSPSRRMRPGKGPGFVSGGGIPSAAAAAPAASAASGPGMAVIAPTKEAAARLLSSPGGQSALLDAIGQLRHNGQLGGA